MKDQYFGDENDYKKYGLLRALANEGMMRIAVCWMLTDAEQSNNGNKTNYLFQPEKWRALDRSLFDSLRQCVAVPDNRSVDWAKDAALIPGALYFNPPLRDNAGARGMYFERFVSFAGECDLAFFDPDIGLEVQSTGVTPVEWTVKDYAIRSSIVHLLS